MLLDAVLSELVVRDWEVCNVDVSEVNVGDWLVIFVAVPPVVETVG